MWVICCFDLKIVLAQNLNLCRLLAAMLHVLLPRKLVLPMHA